MSKNVGTLVSSSIRPVDTNDPIASAYAKEIKGGLHTAADNTVRNAIIFERREWGMMCYVVDQDKTYQLAYNYSSASIMDNNNWVEFSGSGGGGGSEWVDSVISIQNSPPASPTSGDRYVLGSVPAGAWSGLNSGLIVQWNSVLNQWDSTTPSDGMSLVVDNEDGAIYRYETQGGTYPFPYGTWTKERIGQIRDITLATSNGSTFSASSDPVFSTYVSDMIFLTKFSSTNIGSTVSVNINGIGPSLLKKPSVSGLVNFNPFDIEVGIVYNMVYDGFFFQLNRSFVNEELFNVKYMIEPTDYIVVPQNYQYWVYSDLTISGTLVNYGQVIIANGSVLLTGGTLSNYGSLSLVNLNAGSTSSYNDSSTIDFTTQNTIYGLSVSAIVKDGSLTASKLDSGSNGGATAGYFLSVDSSGTFVWSNSVAGAGNGLTQNGGVLDVNVNSESLEISNDFLRLKDTIIGNRTFQDSLTINGNLVVNGTVSYIQTETLLIEDNIITLNASFSGTPFMNAGIEVVRGSQTASSLIWNESTDTWKAGLSGSEVDILLNSGTGLIKLGPTISLDLISIVGFGLTQNGNQISVNASSISEQPFYQYVTSSVTTGNNSTTGAIIASTPSQYSRLQVFINGQLQKLGDGSISNVDCYFSNDSGVSALILGSVSTGNTLYWNGSTAKFDLDSNDEITIVYET